MKALFSNEKLKTLNTMNKYKWVLAAFVGTMAVSVNAQTTETEEKKVEQNVTVEREYKPAIEDAGKITSVPQQLEVNIPKTAAQYSDFNFPMGVGQNVQTLSAAELENIRRKAKNDAYVRAGLGNYANTMLDFALPIVKLNDMRLDLKANHLGTFDTKTNSNSRTALSFDKNFKKFDLFAGVGLGHHYFKYYGDNFDKNVDVIDLKGLKPEWQYEEMNFTRVNRVAQKPTAGDLANMSNSNVLWRFNAFAGVRSLPNTDALRYEGKFEYSAFDARNGMTENVFHTKFGFNNKNQKNRLGMDFDVYNLMYKSKDNIINFWDAYHVFAFNPYYSFERETWNIRLGVKSSFSFIHGKAFNPSPDISAEWRAVPKYLAIYGGVGGSYDVNTKDKLFAENRFLFPDTRVSDTYTPINAFVGVKFKPVHNLLVDAYLNYKYIDNQYFFVNKNYKAIPPLDMGVDSTEIFTNRFNVIYSSASLLKIGLRANYNVRDIFNVQVKGSYNGWTTYDELLAWNKPKWEFDATTDVKINRNLNVTASLFYEGKRYTKFGETINDLRVLSPKVDMNFGVSYSYLDWFTVFGRVNNIFNSKYQEFYGYDVQGFNVMAGAAFSF